MRAHMYVYVCAYAHIYIVEVRAQLVGVVLSLYCVGPGDELRLSELTMRAVTHWVISPDLIDSWVASVGLE